MRNTDGDGSCGVDSQGANIAPTLAPIMVGPVKVVDAKDRREELWGQPSASDTCYAIKLQVPYHFELEIFLAN